MNISDRMDLDWLIDMYGANHQMMISVAPNSLNEHIVNYGEGASKAISHECWLAWQEYKQINHRDRRICYE